MKSKISFLVIGVILGISSFKASAQSADQTVGKTKFSIEIDPATFVFNGYSAHLRIQPKSCNHPLYGVGIYAMDMPAFFVEMNSNNADKGWQVRINNAVGIFGEHHFSEVNKGVFVGSQLSVQQFKIENDNQSGEEKFTNGLIMAYGGYTLQPFKFPLYFKAWGGVGYTSKISGENVLGGQEYDIHPYLCLPLYMWDTLFSNHSKGFNKCIFKPYPIKEFGDCTGRSAYSKKFQRYVELLALTIGKGGETFAQLSAF